MQMFLTQPHSPSVEPKATGSNSTLSQCCPGLAEILTPVWSQDVIAQIGIVPSDNYIKKIVSMATWNPMGAGISANPG